MMEKLPVVGVIQALTIYYNLLSNLLANGNVRRESIEKKIKSELIGVVEKGVDRDYGAEVAFAVAAIRSLEQEDKAKGTIHVAKWLRAHGRVKCFWFFEKSRYGSTKDCVKMLENISTGLLDRGMVLKIIG